MNIIDKLIEELPFLYVFQSLCADCEKKYGVNFKCPFCGSDAFSMLPDKMHGHCHHEKCRATVNIINLVQRLYSYGHDEATEFLCDTFGIDQESQGEYKTVPRKLIRMRHEHAERHFVRMFKMYMAYYNIRNVDICNNHEISTSRLSEVLGEKIDIVGNKSWRDIVRILRYEFNYSQWIKDMNDHNYYTELVTEIENYKKWQETINREIYN